MHTLSNPNQVLKSQSKLKSIYERAFQQRKSQIGEADVVSRRQSQSFTLKDPTSTFSQGVFLLVHFLSAPKGERVYRDSFQMHGRFFFLARSF